MDDFAGRIVHPQKWPDDLDYAGKRVVVIGSGATAVTLVPAMARDRRATSPCCSARPPTSSRARRRTVRELAARKLPGASVALLADPLEQRADWACISSSSRAAQARADRSGRSSAASRWQLGPDYDVDTHFTPRYNPWDQRLCLVPDGDLFRAIRAGSASVVTDEIDTSPRRASGSSRGEELEADIIVTATGLKLQAARRHGARRRRAHGSIPAQIAELQGHDV